MKKICFYFISAFSIIFILAGLLLKKGNLATFGFYLHYIDMTYLSLEEYKNSKKITFKTIFYPTMLVVATILVIYLFIPSIAYK